MVASREGPKGPNRNKEGQRKSRYIDRKMFCAGMNTEAREPVQHKKQCSSKPGGGALGRQADVRSWQQHLNKKLTHRTSEAWWRHFWAKPKSLCSSFTSTRHLPDHKLLIKEIFPWEYEAPHINILFTWQSPALWYRSFLYGNLHGKPSFQDLDTQISR